MKKIIKKSVTLLKVLLVLNLIVLTGGILIFSQGSSVQADFGLSISTQIDLKNNVLGENTQRTQANRTIESFYQNDKRAYIFDMYFLANQSPLYGQGSNIVEACETYGAPKDCTIIAAIARNESNLCKYYGSAEMHNCWGFGGGGEYRRSYSNFRDPIFIITDVLVNQYGRRYILDPSLMQTTFCGSEPACAWWGNNIKTFVKEIDEFGKSLGLGSVLDYRNR